MASSSRNASLDPVSFLFAQVLTQVDYLYEAGHLSQNNYASIAGALLQNTPPGTPAAAHPSHLFSDDRMSSESRPFVTSPVAAGPGSGSGSRMASQLGEGNPAPSTSYPLPSPAPVPPQHPSQASSQSRTPSSLLRLKKKVSSTASPSSTSATSPAAPLSTTSRVDLGNTPPQQPRASTSNTASTAGADAGPPRPRITTNIDDGEENDEELGKVNRRLRKAFQGGFLLSQVVDQALSVTPFFPGSLKDAIVDKVEEESGPFVHRMTDPRRQAAAKRKALKAGSTIWQVARGGGGTSRASSLPAGYSYRGDLDHKTADWGDESGEFSIFAEKRGDLSSRSASPGRRDEAEPPYQITSIHSFNAGPSVILTTTTTATFLKEEEDVLAMEEARFAGFAPEQVNSYEYTNPPSSEGACSSSASTSLPPIPSSSSHAAHAAQPSQHRVSMQPSPPRPPKDPTVVTGHDW